MPRYVDQDAYPRRGADFATARRLAAGHTGGGHALIFFGGGGVDLHILQYDLQQIGIDLQRTITRGPGVVNVRADINVQAWSADYVDPADVLGVILGGTLPYDATFASDPPYGGRLRVAARLTGAKRYATYGALDLEIARKYAPLAALWYANDRIFVSARVKSFVYQPLYGLDLGSVELG